MNICIIGLGLIGGSFALALRKHALVEHIFGVDASPRNAKTALEKDNRDEIRQTIERANTIRKILDNK